MALVKTNANAKFNETIEAHINLNLDKKTGQVLRGNVIFPKKFGKTLSIWAFVSSEKIDKAKAAGAAKAGGEELVKEIESSGKANFDLAVAEPSLMRALAKVAKILGPKGLMPSPKNCTVSDKSIEAIKEFSAGKVSFKSDEAGILHQTIGKADFSLEELSANFKALMSEIERVRPESQKGVLKRSVYLTSTMGRSVKVL